MEISAVTWLNNLLFSSFSEHYTFSIMGTHKQAAYWTVFIFWTCTFINMFHIILYKLQLMFFNYHGCPYANETLSANIYNVLHTHKHFCCYLYDKNVYTYIKYIVFQAVFNKYIFYTKARRIREMRSIMAYLCIDCFMERLCFLRHFSYRWKKCNLSFTADFQG